MAVIEPCENFKICEYCRAFVIRQVVRSWLWSRTVRWHKPDGTADVIINLTTAVRCLSTSHLLPRSVLG